MDITHNSEILQKEYRRTLQHTLIGNTDQPLLEQNAYISVEELNKDEIRCLEHEVEDELQLLRQFNAHGADIKDVKLSPLELEEEEELPKNMIVRLSTVVEECPDVKDVVGFDSYEK